MQRSTALSSAIQTAARVLLVYVLWLGNAALAALAVVLARQFLLRLAVVFRWGPWAMGAIDKFGLLVCALVWLGWVIYAEGAYRAAAGRGLGRLGAVALRTTIPVAVLHLTLGGIKG